MTTLQQVINGGYCIGCGACAALDTSIRIDFDTAGRLQAVLPHDRVPTDAATGACPFTGIGPDENAQARDLITAPGILQDGRNGRYLA